MKSMKTLLLAFCVLCAALVPHAALAQEAVAPEDMFSERDWETSYDPDSAVLVELTGTGAQCSSASVLIEGSCVTLCDEGVYLLSGTLEDGMIIVDAQDSDKVQIILDSVQIRSASSAALYVRQADKVFVTAPEGTHSELSNAGEFVAIDDNNIDAVIFSKADLTLNGAGEVAITTQNGHGVVSKDDLRVTGGVYTISASGHGLSGKDSVRIGGGAFTIASGKDGVHAENDDEETSVFLYIADGVFDISAGGDGLSGAAYVQIDGGTFTILSGEGASELKSAAGAMPEGFDGQMPGNFDGQMPEGFDRQMPEGFDGQMPERFETQAAASLSTQASRGGSGGWTALAAQEDATQTDASTSTKGIKATGELCISGGSFDIDAQDDALHSNAELTIRGGTFLIATGDDALHADAALTIQAGTLTISRCYEGLEGLSVDILGGEIDLVASDDGINAAGGNDQSGFGGRGGDVFAVDADAYVNIAGGTIHIDASGDGIDSNGSLTVSGGEVYIEGPQSGGDGALDYASQATVSGGVVVATGAAQMAMNFDSSSTQGAMLITLSASQAGGEIVLTDADGNVLVSWSTQKTFDSVVISCPGLVQGESYVLRAGEEEISVVLDSLVYGIGGMGGMGFGGRGGGMGFSGRGGGRR